MKKLATFVFALLLGASLSLAQATSGTTKTTEIGKIATTDTGKKGKTKTKTHSHKGGKKGSKKGKELNPQPLPPKPPAPNETVPK